MINKKEDPEKLMPLPGWVKVQVHLPKTVVTDGGIILTNNTKKTFDGIELYDCTLLSKGAGVPEHLNISGKYLMDKFAGVAIPTTGDTYIKMVQHTLLLGETKGDRPEDYIPNHERLLVKITSLRDKTESGIYIPENPKSIFDLDTLGGEIISVSPDQRENFAAGEEIRWEAFQGMILEFKKGGKFTYVSIPVYAVIAKVVQG